MNKKIIPNEITGPKAKALMDCFHLSIKPFNKSEIIEYPLKDKNRMGVIISGTAYLATINLDYQKRIIDYYEADDIFCNHMISYSGTNSYYIYAKSKGIAAFLDYREFVKDNNEDILELQAYLLADTGRRLLEHINILSQRTLRNKLIFFFTCCRNRNASDSFVLPMSLSELADYLAVDRSAMMREIGKMKEENIISSIGRKITLLS